MSQTPRISMKAFFATLLGFVLVGAPLVAIPAQANVAGTGVVINELYMNGGSASAVYTNKFVSSITPRARTSHSRACLCNIARLPAPQARPPLPRSPA